MLALLLATLLLLPAARRAPPKRVFLIGPGAGACGAVLRATGHAVTLATDHEYDVNGRRYPPGWVAMRGVPLAEAEAVEDYACSSRNLATWASKLYLPGPPRALAGIDLDGVAAADQSRAATEFVRPQPERDFGCIVAGSRGGQVTLPAMWLLGCRRPAVVVNAGLLRDECGWVWPPGVPVVALAGGKDFFAENDDDDAYVARLWRAVPPASRAVTALVFVPSMEHKVDGEMLRALLPDLVAAATTRLRRRRARRLRLRVPSRRRGERAGGGSGLVSQASIQELVQFVLCFHVSCVFHARYSGRGRRAVALRTEIAKRVHR